MYHYGTLMTTKLVNKSCGLVWTIVFSHNQQNSINILELVKTSYIENKQAIIKIKYYSRKSLTNKKVLDIIVLNFGGVGI